MNKANSLHNPYKLGEFTAQMRWYQLDSQGRIPHETIIDKRIYVIPHRHDHGCSNRSLKKTATLEPPVFTFAS